jgi:cytochrome b pre-mRNA-processing protein 3
LTPQDRLKGWRPSRSDNTEKLYGAIVAQARLPAFYLSYGLPDTLEGRFTVLALYLFAVLHRLSKDGPEGRALAQQLVDRFTKDMETVLRELGVSDNRIPKSMRRLAGSSQDLLTRYETAFSQGESALTAAIKAGLPDETVNAELSSRALASYLRLCADSLEQQPFAALQCGALKFPDATESR